MDHGLRRHSYQSDSAATLYGLVDLFTRRGHALHRIHRRYFPIQGHQLTTLPSPQSFNHRRS